MFQKSTRIQNKELIEFIKKECPCVVCATQPVDAHHIKTKKSGGDDVVHNLMPLCRKHHTKLHRIGLNLMAEEHSGVLIWLQAAGWSFDYFKDKWIYSELTM